MANLSSESLAELKSFISLSNNELAATLSGRIDQVERQVQEKDELITELEAQAAAKAGTSKADDRKWKREGHKIQFNFNAEVLASIQTIEWAIDTDKIETAKEKLKNVIKFIEVQCVMLL